MNDDEITCFNCLHGELDRHEEPCKTCFAEGDLLLNGIGIKANPKWEPENDTKD